MEAWVPAAEGWYILHAVSHDGVHGESHGQKLQSRCPVPVFSVSSHEHLYNRGLYHPRHKRTT